MASRHLSRSIAMQSLYEWDFYGAESEKLKGIVERNIQEFGPGLEDKTFVWQLIAGVVQHLPEINKIIEKAAPEWPLNQITITDRNVLRIGLYELLYANKEEVPPKVAINEAIELAKTFGGESSGKFINGVLGTVFKEMPESAKGAEAESMPEEILAGGIVFRKKGVSFQVALIKDVFNYWTFPKGHAEAGESLEQTALREIKEEIGLVDLTVVKNLGERVYNAKDNEKGNYVKRKVTDFLLETVETGNNLKAEDSSGIKEAKWFNLDEIASLQQYNETAKVLKSAIEYLKSAFSKN